jgi:hypothetical protein
MLCLSYYCLFALFNRTEKSTEQVLPEKEWVGREKVGVRAAGRNDPNNVCTCE